MAWAKRVLQWLHKAARSHCRHTSHWLGSGRKWALGIGSIYCPPMPELAPDRSAVRPVDAVALARVQQRLQRAATPPWLHGEVARRMAQRLPVVRLQPDPVVDWASFTGASESLLRTAYPRARVLTVEPDPQRLQATALAQRKPWWQPWQKAPVVLAPENVPAGQAQLLWSNMALHGAVDPQALMQQWQQALAVDGFLMFSTLGPGTLVQLGALYRRLGWPPPMAPFVDMHDLGDMLVQAGFADPVMDQETVTLTWAGAEPLLAELRQLGGNVDPRRGAGLRTPRWRQRLMQALGSSAGADGRLSLDFEIVYGHAFKPLPRARLAAQTEVPLEDMRAMMRRGRRVG